MLDTESVFEETVFCKLKVNHRHKLLSLQIFFKC